MNKKNNNLEIKKLVETEWFEQFNKEQQNQILQGLEKNVDVSIYAKIEFSQWQMEQIRLG